MRPSVLVVLAALALAGCGGDSNVQEAAPGDAVEELANILDLRADFEADAGKTRVILLLSPT